MRTSPPHLAGLGRLLLTGLVVALGAALGAMGRFLVTQLTADISIPTITSTAATTAVSVTVVNLLGCALFGAVSQLTRHRPLLGAFAGTGICGGFTTFSAFILLFFAPAPPSLTAGLALLTIHLLLCPAAYLLGQLIADRRRA